MGEGRRFRTDESSGTAEKLGVERERARRAESRLLTRAVRRAGRDERCGILDHLDSKLEVIRFGRDSAEIALVLSQALLGGSQREASAVGVVVRVGDAGKH